MSDLPNAKQLRARRPVLQAPKPRVLDRGGAGSSAGDERRDSPAGLGDGWIEQGPPGAGEEPLVNLAYVAPERDPVDMILDMHLRSWYEWRLEYRYGKGHKAAAVTNEYRAPGHFDWANGAAQERADDLVDRAVDEAVQRVPNAPERWRTAIEFEAMNLHCKAAVWESPYLPKNPRERDTLVLEARNLLLRELRTAGVMT